MLEDKLAIYNAREHNLKQVDLQVPRNQFIVFCGVSGSGKSSMAFDTIYAEGQRRYMESLSVQARQLLGGMSRPRVDHIEGLSPAIAIDQRSASDNPRSTVGTMTDIYTYLRVMFARLGQPFCYECGRKINAYTASQITDEIMAFDEDTRFRVLAPIQIQEDLAATLRTARQSGFVRLRIDGEVMELSDAVDVEGEFQDLELVVDRLVMQPDVRSRVAESVEVALARGDDTVIIDIVDGEDITFSTRFACSHCNITYPELTPQLFSFNHPDGMCAECEGMGRTREIDPDLFVAAPDKSILDGALEVYGEVRTAHVRHILDGLSKHYGFDIETPWKDLSEEVQQVILFGSGDEEIEFSYETQSGREYSFKRTFEGLVPSTESRSSDGGSQQQSYLEKFYALRRCPACEGSRLCREGRSVRIGGKALPEIADMDVETALEFFNNLNLGEQESVIAEEILDEVRSRLRFMREVGVGYLTLDRAAPTLAGGEAQRLQLATQLGSGLAGVLYILDEPSIGLHPQDQQRLLSVLERLRDIGNTVIVVEHDPLTIESADHIVEFGPDAGTDGGQIVYTGDVAGMKQSDESLTGKYLTGELAAPNPPHRRDGSGHTLSVHGAEAHNLKAIDVDFPLGELITVTGVSGSGKSTLINDVLSRALRRELHNSTERPGPHDSISGDEHIDKVINIDQSPIGRTPRSNPATYSGAFTPIRELFASTPEANRRGYEPGRFSFNVKGGRCEACSGDGMVKIEMQFLSDVYTPCQQCGGARYNRQTLQVTYKGKNIAEVLDFTVEEALGHFGNVPKIERVLQTLSDVGLDYIKLGQPAPTLSGGEAQRLKLARELSKVGTGNTLYILDEPTTGLHFADIEQLMDVLNRVVDAGNTVIVIEHNIDVIRMADWVIDLGPGGGDDGGCVVATGTPEDIAATEESRTGAFLQQAVEL